MSVCCECCVLSGRGLCDELITHPEQSYRQWCVVVCDLEASGMMRPWPAGGCGAKIKNIYIFPKLMFENFVVETQILQEFLRNLNLNFDLYCSLRALDITNSRHKPTK